MYEDDYSMYTVCKDCGHSMSMHIGMQNMGGGHMEPIGYTHNTTNGICECFNYEDEE
jgi:hypothetical protein